MKGKIYIISIYLLIITIFFADWFADALKLIPRQITWFSEIIIFFLLLAALEKSGLKRLLKFKYNWFLFSLAGLSLISFILNAQSPFMLVSILHKYFKYMVMAAVLFSLGLELDIYKKTFKFLTAVILIQVPVSYFQRIYYAPISGLRFAEDAAGGTLGRTSTDTLSCACAVFIVLFIKNFISSGRKLYIFLALIMYIPAVYASTKFSFIFYPLIFIFMAGIFFYNQDNLFRKKFLKLAIVTIITLSVNCAFIFWHEAVAKRFEVISWFKNPVQILDYEMKIVEQNNLGVFRHEGRIAPCLKAHSLFKERPDKLIFGFGGCSAGESYLKGDFTGRLYKKGFSIYKPSFIKILVEFGIAGLLLYFLLLFQVLFEGLKSKNYLLTGLSFVLLGMSFYTATWDNDVVSFLFWFILAASLSYKEIGLD
ncbi:MAG: hypothetical protein JW867_08650 [Candidatus Omnitrophica bacterium]|nr:hypothetical protein [Candidatus Omnitrophota bacterium]